MSKTKLRVDWIVLKGDSMVCSRCGVSKKLMPCPVLEIRPRLDEFEAAHRDCVLSSVGDTAKKKAAAWASPLDWILGDDTGTSSRTIWGVMMGAKNSDPSVPYDPADFGRCYRLLEAFPEWRERLPEVAKAFPAWRGLVGAWDEMTALFEEEAQREDGRGPKLWELMKSLREGVHGGTARQRGAGPVIRSS